ncbi:MAG: DUF3108 domain-containing protein [Pseudomonadales bacterium]
MPISHSLRIPLVAFCIALCCCTKTLAGELKPYVAQYKSVVSGFSVDLHREFARDGAQYSVSMKMKKLFFGIKENSDFEIDQDGIVKAISYSHIRSGASNRHNTHLQFDWSANHVSDLLIKNHVPLNVDFPTYDKLSYQPQFRLDLITKPLAQRYEYQLASYKRVKLYAYDFVAEETIETPLGKLRTLKFERDHGAKKRENFIWFAKDWDYLVARIDYIDKPGSKPDRLLIQSATIEGKPVAGL